MKILFLTQVLPYPPDAGPRVRAWNVIRYLVGSGHEIHLASFVRQEEEPYLAQLRRLCASVTAVPMKRSRATDIFAWARSLLEGRPFLIERDNVGGMRERVRWLLTVKGIEAIHADQLPMAQFAEGVQGSGDRPLLIFDAHNAIWKVVERTKRQLPWLMAPLIDLEARRTKAYEGRMIRRFDRTLAVSEVDRSLLAEAASRGSNGAGSTGARERIRVVPIGIDTEQLRRVVAKRDSRNVLALGTLHYPPNADGIRWFAQEVLPRVLGEIADTTLTIVGRNPPRDIRALGAKEPITVTGYVEDLTPYLEAAALMVVPVRAGGGVRVRILEGFARGLPMVTTTVGLEGIEAWPGRDILVADTPEDFALAVIDLLRSPQRRAELVANGRRFAEERYDWHAALRPLDTVYQTDRVKTDAA